MVSNSLEPAQEAIRAVFVPTRQRPSQLRKEPNRLGQQPRNLLLLGACCLFLSSCGGGGDGTTNAPPTTTETTSKVVGSEGGTLTLPEIAEVTIPVGSIRDPLNVTLSKVSEPEHRSDFADTVTIRYGAYVQGDYQVIIVVSGDQPTAPIDVRLGIPVGLRQMAGANGIFKVFATAWQVGDLGRLATVEPLSGTVDAEGASIVVSVPPEMFSDDLEGSSGQFMAVLHLSSSSDSEVVSDTSVQPKAFLPDAACRGHRLLHPLYPSTDNVLKQRSPFGPRVHPKTKKRTNHNGVDLEAAVGTSVSAMASGEITGAGFQYNKKKGTGWGNYIVLKHDGGGYSLYAHLQQNWKDAVGTRVQAGQYIARSGATGGVTGPHLHVEFLPTRNYANVAQVDVTPCLSHVEIESVSCTRGIGSIAIVNFSGRARGAPNDRLGVWIFDPTGLVACAPCDANHNLWDGHDISASTWSRTSLSVGEASFVYSGVAETTFSFSSSLILRSPVSDERPLYAMADMTDSAMRQFWVNGFLFGSPQAGVAICR